MARPILPLLLVTFSCHHALGFAAARGPLIHQAGWSRPKQRRTFGVPSRAPAVRPTRRLVSGRPVRRASSPAVLLSAAEDAPDLTSVAAAAAALPAQPLPKRATETTAGRNGRKKGASLLASNASLAAIVVAEFALRKAFVRAGLAFPASLAGMVGLFAGLVTLERAVPESAEKAVSLLEPGAAVLARWLPVFFAPSLVVLPLSPAPSSTNALKLLVLVCGGWFLSLSSTAAVVTALSPGTTAASDAAPDAATATAPAKPARPAFRGSLVWKLGVGAALAGVVAVVGGASGQAAGAAAAGVLAKLWKPAAQLSMLLATLFGFTAGTRLPRRVSKAVHPVVTCTAVAMAVAAGIGRGVGVGFADMLRSYLTRSRCPVHLGAGDLLLGLLGPSVLSFAVQMYRRRTLIFKNAKQVAGGSIFCASSGLFGTALVSRLFDLPTTLRLATLSRNITSPLAMAICSLVEADPSLAIAIVVVTGVIGANFGPAVLDALGVKDPAARGLAQGGSAHGLGTAAMVNEPTCFAFSAVSMALTATVSTVLVTIPAVRQALLRLALGAAATASGLPAP